MKLADIVVGGCGGVSEGERSVSLRRRCGGGWGRWRTVEIDEREVAVMRGRVRIGSWQEEEEGGGYGGRV